MKIVFLIIAAFLVSFIVSTLWKLLSLRKQSRRGATSADDAELVAVITAAICASRGKDAPDFSVHSVRPAYANPAAKAGFNTPLWNRRMRGDR